MNQTYHIGTNCIVSVLYQGYVAVPLQVQITTYVRCLLFMIDATTVVTLEMECLLCKHVPPVGARLVIN